MRYKIKIELLSDMCPSSGEVYNSSVDTEIDYDSYGIPYLSAKRLKGCLRESAQMLKEWGKDVHMDELFGNRGSKKGNLRISSAVYEQYEIIRKEMEQYKGSPLTHPQNVLSLFSYVRTQTAMEDGVAKEGSLRILRVLKKGLKFEAEAEFDDIYRTDMEMICKCTRNMGLNRTRGLGEIQITLEESEQENKLIPEGMEKINVNNLDEEKQYRIYYRLKFLEPVILKSPDKGQEKTQDYIEGSKMLGVLAEHFGNEAYRRLTEEKRIICSNLYITDSAERYLPVPISRRVLKDDKSEMVYDLAAGYKTDEQTQGLGNIYISDTAEKMKALSVETQIRYHHSRPKDKSVGRVRTDGDGELYQLSSILAGQTFSGFIQGTGKQIEVIAGQMKTMRFVNIGYGSASEYGKTELVIDDLKENTNESKEKGSKILVKLLAPMLLYDNVGMYTQDINVLREEIEQKVGKKLEIDTEHIYLKYTVVGGWQSMWKKPKQTAYVLDKGTVITMYTKEKEDICIPEQSFFAGERTAEGYGEICICAVPEISQLQKVSKKKETEKENDIVTGVFIEQLEEKQEIKEVKRQGRISGQCLVEEAGKSCAAVVNKLLLTLKEQETEEKFCEVCRSVKTKEKLEIANLIVEKTEDMPKCKQINREEVFRIYMKALLTEAKYLVKKSGEEETANE